MANPYRLAIPTNADCPICPDTRLVYEFLDEDTSYHTAEGWVHSTRIVSRRVWCQSCERQTEWFDTVKEAVTAADDWKEEVG